MKKIITLALLVACGGYASTSAMSLEERRRIFEQNDLEQPVRPAVHSPRGRVKAPAGLEELWGGGRLPDSDEEGASSADENRAPQPGRLNVPEGSGLAGLFGGGGSNRGAIMRAQSELQEAKQFIADKYGISIDDLK